MAVVIIGDDPKQIESMLKALTKSMDSEPDESVLDLTKYKEEKIKVAFEITDEELEVLENDNQKKAVINLVIERVALLSTRL
jgi:tRNA threonylcarbamoyladenosine modification (KEOPS) complex Cgi121 subunit